MNLFVIRNYLKTSACLIVTGLCLGLALAVAADSTVFAYPNAGQSSEQQARDRFECHQWAVSQTGFDPTTATPLPQPVAQPQQPVYDNRYPEQRQNSGVFGLGDGGMFEGSGALGDAATGAALGAAGGAIAGDAGKGAAIGALSGTVLGALTRASDKKPRAPDYEVTQQRTAIQAEQDRRYQDRQARVDSYQRAYGASMRARDYTIN